MKRSLLALSLLGALVAGPLVAQGHGHKKEFEVAPSRPYR